jgi:predicted O-methyltransferase YrrM
MPKIPSVVFDSTNASTDLCALGTYFNSDKSPYNTKGHRHPYTALYSLLFARFRTTPVRFAEIGIAGGASMIMWRHYFLNPHTSIFGFDCDQNFISNLLSFGLPRVSAFHMNVESEESIHQGLVAAGGDIDVLLDDSTHGILEQVKILRAGLPFVKSGGLIVIEDVFRRIPDADYEVMLEEFMPQLSFACFYVTEHERRWSPDWENDKVLVLIKK